MHWSEFSHGWSSRGVGPRVGESHVNRRPLPGLVCIRDLLAWRFYFFDFCFMMRGKRVSVVSLLSPRPVRFFHFPLTTHAFGVVGRRDTRALQLSLEFVFLASSPVIAPFRVLFVSERDGIRLLA